MSYFAAVLARAGDRWRGEEVSLEGCESVEDLADVARDVSGDLRLLVIEQDDEYAAIVRVDSGEDEPRAFLSDGHAAEEYPLAAVLADELIEIGAVASDDDEAADDFDDEDAAGDAEEELLDGTAAVHDSAPFGDADIVEDLGTAASDLLALCAHEGTLPIDLLAAVCEKAGCAETFDDLRA